MIGLDNRTGSVAALDDVDLRRLVAAIDAGCNRKEIAERFGITERTVYRYAGAKVVEVEVEGWLVAFVVRRNERPYLVTRRRGRSRIQP